MTMTIIVCSLSLISLFMIVFKEKELVRLVDFISKEIFDRMLVDEKNSVEKLAFDSPTKPFLRFLAKHYNLLDFLPQTNNFVVYREFFSTNLRNQVDYAPKIFLNNKPNQLNEKRIANVGSSIICMFCLKEII